MSESTKKDTNPKDAVGTGKVPFSTVSAPVTAEIGLAMLEGARKYGRHNYRVAGVRASVYYDAALRHLASWWEGEDIDPDSGLSHVTKALASLAVLRDSMIQKNWIDDRPPVTPGGWMADLNAKAKAIVAKYPDAVPAHTRQTAEAAASSTAGPTDKKSVDETSVACAEAVANYDEKFGPGWCWAQGGGSEEFFYCSRRAGHAGTHAGANGSELGKAKVHVWGAGRELRHG